jgi:hypothetical protein
MILLSIPSPGENDIGLGPFDLRAYGLTIAIGVVAAANIAGRRWGARGGKGDDIAAVALWAVPAGLVGAAVPRDHRLAPLRRAVVARAGRLGGRPRDPGTLAAGVLVGVWAARRRGLPVATMLDRIRDEATDDWDDHVAVERFEGKGGRYLRGEGRIVEPGPSGGGRGTDVQVAAGDRMVDALLSALRRSASSGLDAVQHSASNPCGWRAPPAETAEPARFRTGTDLCAPGLGTTVDAEAAGGHSRPAPTKRVGIGWLGSVAVGRLECTSTLRS